MNIDAHYVTSDSGSGGLFGGGRGPGRGSWRGEEVCRDRYKAKNNDIGVKM